MDERELRMKKQGKKGLLLFLFIFIFMFLLGACGKKGLRDLEEGYHYYYPSKETGTEIVIAEEAKPYYMILSNDMVAEVIRVYDYDTDLEYQYRYGLTTDFKDKYGNRSSAIEFTAGRVVWVGDLDEDGKLKDIGISDQVWEYEDIVRFKTDPEQGRLTIADTLYSYGNDAFTFSKEEIVEFGSIQKNDILSVVGIGKRILSVNITTGQGTLELENTDLFEGSFVQIGSKIFAEVTKNMEMDLPEGTYKLAVANNGWGGSTEITIVKGETTVVDLDLIKGDGPQTGLVTFKIKEAYAQLYIDGEWTDYVVPVALTYGKHTISVITDDYGEWKRYLYVNSPTATIEISVEEASKSQGNQSSDSGTKTPGTEKSDSQSTENSSTESSSQSNSTDYSDLYKYLQDYLSTLSSLL